MRLRDIAFTLSAAGAATFVYGILVESKRLVLERRTLKLKNWPKPRSGFRIGVLADLHIRDSYSLEHGQKAVLMALDEQPDVIVLPGDLISYWKPETAEMLHAVLEPLREMKGRVIATPGNREYWLGDSEMLRPILDDLGIKLLRNEPWVCEGVEWIGIDSVNARKADPYGAFQKAECKDPLIALWHEPDLVEWLPKGADLMISGHTHGGQFRLPNGWAPIYTENGRRYPDGFFPDAPTPLYVSRGIGTTGPPSRLNCPPEVSLLTIVSQRT